MNCINQTQGAVKIGFALTGSFCTFSKALEQMQKLVALGYDVRPIMSENAYKTDTRFGSSEEFINMIEGICGKKIISTIVAAEPIGPKKLLDLLLIAPCTGNTLGKLANGISDTSVTLAAKAHLRNLRPALIAVSSNDALSSSAKNIGLLFNMKNIYFVPMRQDDPTGKNNSLVADFDKIPDALEAALHRRQIQPVFT
ncbi:MAG: dipicolinate synthase subunit B [Oscillospiraceae bacterium]|jgi:dipicolinate synthase subunit B|nr:dipicolinate synthase subunit B [Oscillospiraceae bacterium]